MSTYSIKDLEHLSGIKAHTIRIWEQRYNLLHPSRTDSNIRTYSDKDLKLLLNVALLNNNGFKISRIATMHIEEMLKEVAGLMENSSSGDEQIAGLTVAMIDMDQLKFEKVMASNILKRGFEETMINIIFPFLHRIGVLWLTGSIVPAQEHFISNLIRQKLIAAIDGQFNNVRPGTPKFVMFLPEGELHEISLLFADYLIRSNGAQSIYLGQSVPLEDLVTVYKMHNPDYVFTVITSSVGNEDIGEFVNGLAKLLGDTKLMVTGYQVLESSVPFSQNVEVIRGFQEIKDFLV